MADSNRELIAFKKETTWGTAATGNYQTARFTQHTLKKAATTLQSREVIATRVRGRGVRTGVQAQGGLQGELSATTYDELIAGAMQTTFPASVVSTGTITDVTFANSGATATRASGSFVTDGFIVGQWVKVAGSSGNDGYFIADGVTATVLTLSGGTVTDEASGASVEISGSGIIQGTSKVSFSLERQLADVTQYQLFTGLVVNQVQFGMKPQEMVSFSADFLGKDGAMSGTSGAGTVVAATTTTPLNTVEDIAVLLEGGVAVTTSTGVSVQIGSNLRGKPALSVAGNSDIGLGGQDVSGEYSIYFANATLFNKFSNYTSSSLAWVWEDAAGKAIGFNMPVVDFGDADLPNPGPDGDVILTLPYTASKDTASGASIIVTVFQ